MNYITPKYNLTNRKVARLFVKEVEKVNEILWSIENSFLNAVFDENKEYNDIYTFHREYFIKSCKIIQPHLKYSVLNFKYFEENYKSVV